MSTNRTILNSATTTESLVVAYYALTLIIVGTIFNLLTFLILCRSSFRDTKTRPTLHYMRTIAIFDILMLYGWNLDHYLTIAHNFHIVGCSLETCKLISFISYFTPQTSAWLRVFVCLDRYLSLSRLYRTWFNKSKSILIIITCVVIFFILLNLHILIFVCYRKKNNTISSQARWYRVYPLWDYVHLGVYNCAPFLLMVVLNSGVIYHLVELRRTTIIQNSRIRHRPITFTLVITTFLFLIMTIPATVAYAFFSEANTNVLQSLDGMLHTYHILSFPLYLITFPEFRRECLTMLFCHHKVSPQMAMPMLRVIRN